MAFRRDIPSREKNSGIRDPAGSHPKVINDLGYVFAYKTSMNLRLRETSKDDKLFKYMFKTKKCQS